MDVVQHYLDALGKIAKQPFPDDLVDEETSRVDLCKILIATKETPRDMLRNDIEKAIGVLPTVRERGIGQAVLYVLPLPEQLLAQYRVGLGRDINEQGLFASALLVRGLDYHWPDVQELNHNIIKCLGELHVKTAGDMRYNSTQGENISSKDVLGTFSKRVLTADLNLCPSLTSSQ